MKQMQKKVLPLILALALVMQGVPVHAAEPAEIVFSESLEESSDELPVFEEEETADVFEEEESADVFADDEWPAPAAGWVEDYEYTISGDTLWLNKYKRELGKDENGAYIKLNITIPATVTIGTKTYKVGLDGGKSGSDPVGIWYPARYNITGIRIEKGVDAGSSTNCLFNNLNAVKTIDVSGLDTSKVTDMSFMFCNCFEVTSIKLDGMDTSKVTNMRCMFNDCRELPSLDLSSFDTSLVTDMHNMFDYNRKMVTLTFGENFKTDNVEDMEGMFSTCEILASLDVSHFNTSKVKSFRSMFESCEAVKKLDVSGFDTSNATSMESMFERCQSLESLDVSHFNTSNVTNMQSMFSWIFGIKNLDLSNFDTSNVQYMSKMFYLTGFEHINVSSFNTSKVYSFSGMFSCCDSLKELDVTNFDTSHATYMDEMFERCESLKTLDLSNFNTSNVTRMGSMFRGTKSLTNLDIRSFDFTKLNAASEEGTNYWNNCKYFLGPINWSGNYGVKNIYLPAKAMAWYDFDYDKDAEGGGDYYDKALENIYYAGTQAQWDALHNTVPDGVTLTCEFNGTVPEEEVTVDPDWYKDYEYTLTDTELQLHRVKQSFSETNVRIPAKATIEGKEYAVVLDRQKPQDGYQNWDGLWVYHETTEQGGSHPSPVKRISFEEGVKVASEADSLFESMADLETVDLTGLDTSAVTTMERWFYCCYKLKKITFGSSFDSSKVTRFNLMFGNCVELTGIDLSKLNTGKGEYLDAMFDQCQKLESIDLSGFDTSSMKYMSAMFAGCESLKTIDLSGFATEKLETATGLFSGCTALTEIKWGSFSTPKLEQMGGMFRQCEKLRRLDLRSFDFTAANSFIFPDFAYCGLLADSGVVDLYLPVKAMSNYDFTMKPVSGGEGYSEFGNIAPYLKNIYYAGTEEEWEALKNTLPADVKVTYGYTGEMKPVADPSDIEEPVTHEYVTNLTLDASDISLLIGGTKILRPTIAPSDAANPAVTWSSSNESVASVSDTGVVTALSGGTTIITATAAGTETPGSVTATCRVRVQPSQVQEGDNEGKTEEETAAFWMAGISDAGYSYTGAAITPTFRLYYGNTLLVEGTDYKTAYKNNKAVKVVEGGGALYNSVAAMTDKKAPYIQITLKGNYSGVMVRSFSIQKKNLGDSDITVVNASSTANGKAQKLKPTLYYRGKAIPAKAYSYEGEGWQVGGYTTAGSYAVTMCAAENSSFTGTASGLVVIKEAAEGQLNLAKLKPVTTATKTDLVYDGTEKKPVYALYNGSASAGLTETTSEAIGDYKVFYENNTAIGTATVRFVAEEASVKCYGSKTVTFKITKPAPINLTGNTAVRVQLLDENGAVMDTPSAVYAKGGAVPRVRVSYNDKLLQEGVDYKLSYKNNKKVTAVVSGSKSNPLVIVTGKGLYKGKTDLPFSITAQDLKNLRLLVDDVVLDANPDRQKAYAYQNTSWTLTDLDGKSLKMGLDFDSVKKGVAASHGTVFYASESKLAAGSVVTLNLCAKTGSNYTGSISASYRVITKEQSLKNSVVTLADSAGEKLSYRNGMPVELTEADLVVKPTKNGTALIPGTDYQIISYNGNLLAGKAAKITIRGIGSYGGMKTVTVTINPLRFR